MKHLLLAIALLISGVSAMMLMAQTPPATAPATRPAAEWVSLLDGDGLAGWKVPQPNVWWKVVDGVLVGESDPQLRGNDLYTEKSYKNFEFETEFRFSGETDTGIYLRRPLVQVQIGTSRSLRIDKTGSLYQEGPGGSYVGHATGVDRLLKEGEWNKLRLVADEDNLKVWLNDQQILETSIAKYPGPAPLGVQIHRGIKMKIEYRHLRLRELP